MILNFKLSSIFFMILLLACNHNNLPTYSYVGCNVNTSEDSILVMHLKQLDSVVYSNGGSKYYTSCGGSVDYLESVSKIESVTDGYIVGKLAFTRKDWIKWHEWYTNNYCSRSK